MFSISKKFRHASVLLSLCVLTAIGQDQFHGYKLGRYEGTGQLSTSAKGKVALEIKTIDQRTGDVIVLYEFTQGMPVSQTFKGKIDENGILRVSGPFLAYDNMEITAHISGTTVSANTRVSTSFRTETGNFTVIATGEQFPTTVGEPVKADGEPVQTQGGNTLRTGDRVDTYYDQQRGRRRGTVAEVGNGKYKVTYGCPNFGDEWKESALVKPAATISNDAPEIRFLLGKWSLTTVGASDLAIAWGKSPGIQVNVDGTLIWYQGQGIPPLRSTWITDAKVPGSQDADGIIFRDTGGILWKIDRWTFKGDTAERMEVYQVCYQAISKTGRRMK
jgi:hypothetical protein